MGKRLLLLTVRVLAILRLTVNPEIHITTLWRFLRLTYIRLTLKICFLLPEMAKFFVHFTANG